MECLPVFSFPSANTTFTSASSPSSTPRKSSHRRQKAVEVPIITAAKIPRTPITYSPPRNYNRLSCRRMHNNLLAIPEGQSQATARPAVVPSVVSTAIRPNCFRSTSAESITTTGSSLADSDFNITPEPCRFSTSNYTTSSIMEPFPRLSMCDIDEDMAEDDDEEFWHCAGLENGESLKTSAVAAMVMEDEEMKDDAFFDKIAAWRDSI